MRRERCAAGALLIAVAAITATPQDAVAVEADASAAVAKLSDPSGGPGREVTHQRAVQRSAPQAPALPESGVAPHAGEDARGPNLPRIRRPRAAPEPAAPVAPARFLASLSEERCLGSRLQVELPGDASVETQAQGARIAELWNAGRWEEALDLLEALEAAGVRPAVGFAPAQPRFPTVLRGRSIDRRLGGSLTGCEHYALDYDEQNGSLFAVISWGSFWTMNISHDDGANWSETYRWSGVGLVDVDLAVVGDWAYVLYVDESAPSELRLRRCDVADGSIDGVYYYKVVHDASPAAITDVALASNAVDFDNRLYPACRVSDNSIAWYYCNEEGLSFTGTSPPIGNALGGLDAHWNENFSYYFYFLSYVGTDGDLHIWRRSDVGWSEVYSIPFTGYNRRTAISAFADTVFCVVEHEYPNEYGIRGYVNYSAGDSTWYYNDVAVPEPGEGFYAMADVSARGGGGIALMYQQYKPADMDAIYFMNRHTYGYSPWNEPAPINEHDATPDTWTAMNWLPPLSSGLNPYGYGMIYEADGGLAYFDRQDGAETAEGDNCDYPITLELPADLPVLTFNWTCGRGNDYADTCMGSFDGGEDVIYELVVTSQVTIDLSVEADTSWAGFALFADCPDVGPNSCIAWGTSGDNPDVIEDLTIMPGTYYLMIDTWPPPDCAYFELIISEDFDETCPDEATFSQPPAAPSGDWIAGVSDLDWYDGPLQRYETYQVLGPVLSLRWWGIRATLDGLANPCDENPMEFVISFHQDAGGIPGDLVCQESVFVAGVDTGYGYAADYRLHRYEVVLDSPCAQAAGWVSIAGVGGPDCGFWWMSSLVGDGFTLHYDDDMWQVDDFDLSACVTEGDCDVPCPPDSIDEGEACGDDTNGGCNMSTPAFTPLVPNAMYCGTAWAEDDARDTDWYEIVIDEPAALTWTVTTEFPAYAGLVEYADGYQGSGQCGDITGVLSPYVTLMPCEEGSVTTDVLPPGTYWFFVATSGYDGVPCGTNNDYVAMLTGIEPPCPGDFNGDGHRDQADLGILLAAYGNDAGGDLDGDGDTDQADLGMLLSVYGIDCD